MLTVHYEIYDGLPLISKWWTLERKPGWYADGYAAEQDSIETQRATGNHRSQHGGLDGFVAPSTPSEEVGGWSATGGKLTVQGGKLDLELEAGAGANAGARYLTAYDSTGATLAPGSATNSGGEIQSSIGLGLSGSSTSREDWEVMASCDAGEFERCVLLLGRLASAP